MVSSFPGSPAAGRRPRVLAVTGGKGGVGKTSIALNLGLVLARMGKRVLLLDGDTDLANINIMLGRYPRYTLEQVITGECTLPEVVLRVNQGLHIIPGVSGVQRCIEMSAADRRHILASLGRIEDQYDYVLVDTAAGLQASVLHMIAAASMAVLVLTPEPTSLTDAFSLVKVLSRRGYRRHPGIVVNMARGASQAQSVFRRFSAAVQRYIGLKPEYLGAVWRDEAIAQSVATQRPVGLLERSDPSCRQFWSLAEMLDMRLDRKALPAAGFAAYWERLAKRQVQKASTRAATVPADRSGQRPQAGVVQKRPATEAAPSSPVQGPEALVRVETQWAEWTRRLRDLMDNPETTPVQRYQALTTALELLGQTMDEDLVEVLQTGLAAMAWDKLPVAQRAHFAAHLRHLADQLEPPFFEGPRSALGAASAGSRSNPLSVAGASAQRPRYDESAFGSQETLLSRLRSQPAEASINDILQAFGYRGDDQADAIASGNVAGASGGPRQGARGRGRSGNDR